MISRKVFLLIFLLLLNNGSVIAAHSEKKPARDLYSDTWTAVDGLGRELGDQSVYGPVKENRFVGIFYWTWHHHGHSGPYDVTEILRNNPADPNWGPVTAGHHWGRPELGYYYSDDPFVLRKHASMLADAGVDVVIFDTTNSPYTFQNEYMALCRVYREMRQDGEKTPYIAFLAPFNKSQAVVNKVFQNLYQPGLYSELWFRWDGKPLIMADPADFADNPEISEFFTFRKPVPSYFTGPSGPNQWGWLEVYPQHVFYDDQGNPEQMTVGVAQNAVGDKLSMMSHKSGAMGRSWHDGSRDQRPGAVNWGLNFSEQWDRALQVDPEFIFITGWNEWIAGRFLEWYIYDCSDSCHDDALFVDQYNHEYSRDIEPMKGGHYDSYYYQMVDYIRKYKGVRPLRRPDGPESIVIDGDFADWSQVTPEFRDTVGDTAHRDHPAFGGGFRYRNTTGRNDFVSLKVAYDSEYIYFYARTARKISPCDDDNWMLLFIDSDMDTETGWSGYDYLINSEVADQSTTLLKRYSSNCRWKKITGISYKSSGNELELSVPRFLLGMKSKNPAFDFHWADNIQKLCDITEFALNGDSAPNRRFNYRFISQNKDEEKTVGREIPNKMVVLTMDDGTESQAAAANLLEKYGFGATFYISQADFNFPGDKKLNWEQIKELHEKGFEIGSHTFSHPDVRKLGREQFIEELERLEKLCIENGIDKPRTFAYPGYHYDEKAAEILKEKGYLFARSGLCVPYDPSKDHPMNIPTCGAWGVLENDSFPPPGNEISYLKSAVEKAENGNIVVLTFHGIAGMDDPESSIFKQFLDYLRENKYQVIAMRDLEQYLDTHRIITNF